ncbi:MAG: DNA polymerase II, partial [Myxococcales bacterium]|nr:DNA polymerase II [Myxococcales bacterium]
MPRGFILQPTYRVRDGVPVVQLFGRLEDGPAFWVEDDRFRPYFFVPIAQRDALPRGPALSIEASELRELDGGAVARVTLPVPSALPPLRDHIARPLEADIRFPYRYLIDRGIRAGVDIDGPSASPRPGLLHFANPALQPADCRPRLRVLCIDLETTPDASAIVSAALVGD